MVLNVSDDGMAISMAIPVGDEAYSNLHVRMNGLAQSVEVHGRMAWTTKSKKRAGIQLVDISDEQRGQIREWLAQEGVRDVDLLPRVSEPAVSIVPASSEAGTKPKLFAEPFFNNSPVVAAPAAINREGLADSRASLLMGMGGTAPEFLGPAPEEPSFTEDTIVETQSSQGSNPNFPGFRENEWDLASVTMVPRKRSKPEGLSALGLLLLWIAIPSFGIGIIAGRRPLQQWLLSREHSGGQNISRGAAPEPQVVNARDESRDITESDIDANGPQSISARVETPATTGSQDVKTSAATKSFVSTPAFVDTKLLNSMSTQELRALKSPASTVTPENPIANEPSKLDSKAEPDTAASPSTAAVKPINRANTFAGTTPSTPPNTYVSAQHGDLNDKSGAAKPNSAPSHDGRSVATNNERPFVQDFSKQTPNDRVARIVSVDSGVNVGTAKHPGGAPANVPPTSAPHIVPSPTATISTAANTDNSTAYQNTAPTSIRSGTGSPQSGPSMASDATPRVAPNVRTTMASTPAAETMAKVVPSSSPSAASRSVAPGGATNLAPINAQSPLHGVMLVARKNNESFLLRLPVEAVANGRAVTVEMQRFVMVPAESRWHRHGPIAKLAVGELLTEISANQAETMSNARPGDAVTVRAFVDKNGTVQDLKPVSGRLALMPRVMHDVREWQFDQTLIDGKPVESEVDITVEFRSGTSPQPNRSRQIQAQNSFKR